MKRREALKLTASLIGTAIIGSELFLSGCANKDKYISLFSDADISFLDEVGEVIRPRQIYLQVLKMLKLDCS